MCGTFARAEQGWRLPAVVMSRASKCLGTNTERGSAALAVFRETLHGMLQKAKDYRALSVRIRSLVTPSAAVRVAFEHSNLGAFFHFWPSRRVAINSLVSEIAQSEQNSTNPGAPKSVWEGGRTDVVQGGGRLHLQTGEAGGFPDGDIVCISADRLTVSRETVAIARKRPARSIVLGKFLRITREDGRWLKQGFKWANA